MYSQANIEALYALMGSEKPHVFESTNYFDYIKTHDCIWPNHLCNLQAKENTIESVLTHIETQVEAGSIPPWLLCNPVKDNPKVIAQILKRGYKKSVWTAMSYNFSSEFPNIKIKLLKLKVVTNQKDFDAWMKIVEEELMGGKALNKSLFQFLLRFQQCYFYLGTLDGKPAATSLLFHHENSAGIYLVATTTEYRKKGIGRAMTVACLKKANTLHCKQAHLQATDLGKPIYKALGFTDHGSIFVFNLAT